jgi:hypothetical protein
MRTQLAQQTLVIGKNRVLIRGNLVLDLSGVEGDSLQTSEKHQTADANLLSSRHLQSHDLRYRDGEDKGVEENVDDGEDYEKGADVQRASAFSVAGESRPIE